jgi:hypothetical protein
MTSRVKICCIGSVGEDRRAGDAEKEEYGK